jgi:hypothetical protein
MSSNWTGQQRYDDTLNYLKTVDNELATHVTAQLGAVNKSTIGDDLSLKGNSMYAMFGDKNAGRAVRALLLCQKAYLGSNWAKQTGGFSGIPSDLNSPNGKKLTVDKYLGKAEAVIQDAIRTYTALNPGIPSVANAAETVQNGQSGINPPYETMTRSQHPFPSGQVCFNCVYWWLFKSGFVSLRWILRNGMSLGAENANSLLGDGTSLTRNGGELPDIPRGYIVNWRGNQPDTVGICHWAVSLGDGYAAGANNTLAGISDRSLGGGKDRPLTQVTFRTGGSQFGVFSIADMWTIYEGDKTFSNSAGRAGCIVAMVDPNGIPNRNTGH